MRCAEAAELHRKSGDPGLEQGEMAKGGDMFVRYSDEVETIHEGEAEISEQIAATLLDIAKKVGERQRHTVRAVHAKSHGLLKAEVTVLPDLREELRQGLFAKPASYGVIMRFSTDPATYCPTTSPLHAVLLSRSSA